MIHTETTASGFTTTMLIVKMKVNGISKLTMPLKHAHITNILKVVITNVWAILQKVIQSGLLIMEILKETSISGFTHKAMIFRTQFGTSDTMFVITQRALEPMVKESKSSNARATSTDTSDAR